MKGGQAAAAFFFETPPPAGRAGAIALARVQGDVSAALHAIGARDVALGQARLRRIAGVDDALVIRWRHDDASIAVHAGPAVVSALRAALKSAGLTPAPSPEPSAMFPHAQDEFEALALAALTRAASPAAVDLLLDQPPRWRAWDSRTPPRDEIERVAAFLNRLIEPPIIAAVGAVNVGKSSLLNALAGRTVSIVADEPGATRDHVGALLTLPITGPATQGGADGFVVRWVDAPGLRLDARGAGGVDALERDAIAAARQIVAQAALLVVCSDGVCPWPDDALLATIGADARHPRLRLRTKTDLPAPGHAVDADLAVSARTGDGLDALARLLADRLLPAEARAWEGPWLFDPRLLEAWRRRAAGVATPPAMT